MQDNREQEIQALRNKIAYLEYQMKLREELEKRRKRRNRIIWISIIVLFIVCTTAQAAAQATYH